MNEPAPREYRERLEALERRVAQLEAFILAAGMHLPGPSDGQSALPATAPADEFAFPELILDFEEQAKVRRGPAEKLDVRAAVEQFPHIAKRISVFWGSRDFERFIATLILDERGNRRGFPMDVMSELMFLARFARFMAPPKVTDIWDDHAKPKRFDKKDVPAPPPAPPLKE